MVARKDSSSPDYRGGGYSPRFLVMDKGLVMEKVNSRLTRTFDSAAVDYCFSQQCTFLTDDEDGSSNVCIYRHEIYTFSMDQTKLPRQHVHAYTTMYIPHWR